jgi:hypothetical protein
MLMLMIFHHPKAKTFCLVSFLALTKKKTLARWQASLFFLARKLAKQKGFCLRMVKNRQHQHKGKPHTHEKIQGAAISRAVAMIIFRGVNLSGTHCIEKIGKV